MYQLYYSPGKASLAPHMLLEEIGADYELRFVDTDANAHNSPEYLKLNPNGRIPTLVDDGFVLYETAAICLHLADRHPEANMVPALGSTQRAAFYQWLIYLTNTLQTELITYFYSERLADDEAMAASVKAHAEQRIGTMLDLIEARLASGGPYLLGERFSAVDPYLLMLGRWTRSMAHPARARPHFGRYLETIAARPAILRTFTAEGLSAPFF